MSSVLFNRGVNSQANNPLRAEINRVISLNSALERRVNFLERELENMRRVGGTPGPKGDKGDRGDRGEKGEKGDKGDRGEKGDST